MVSRLQALWDSPTPWRVGAVVAVQMVLLASFVLDWRVPVVLAAAFVVTVFLLDNPVWAVAGMLAARLLSTGTMSFFTVGKISIGLFEPVLLLALLSLGLRAVFSRKSLWINWPWKSVFVGIILWRVAGLTWCTSKSDGAKEIITLAVIAATSSVVLAFIQTWDDVKTALWWWIGTCVLIGMLAIFGDALGLTDHSSQWKAAEGGGRETGLGQQPNWFAMNLNFVIHAAAGFALVQKRPLYRWGLLLAAVFIFLAAMTSGSRGGAYSVVIGGLVVALGQPLFRKWFLRFAVVGGLAFALAALADLGDLGKGFNRISANVDVLFARDIRGLNWAACIGMFTESFGLGIGPGGYIDNLRVYSEWLYNSVYRYPHGIFWGELAHTGVVGLILLGALVVSIARMSIQTVRDTRGTEAEVLAWAMPASMAGYFAWSFIEFSLDEKPFWEWLALYTALHLVARRAVESGKPLPPWTLSLR
ncbi:MAG: O-antigen ligase family protein [Deltaproteobacteria bacterium]|nr:O-antigen ligase family protein [Deltaproteobacteria bacterium]